MKTRYIIGIGLTCVLLVGFLTIQHLLNSPRRTFERLVQTPIPVSVQSLEQGNLVTMDSTFWVLRFQISKTDLRTLINSQHFAPVDESKEFSRWDQRSQDYVQIQKGEFLKLWKQRILSSSKLDVNFTESWQIYTLKENGGKKYIFTDTNNTEVVFVAEAH